MSACWSEHSPLPGIDLSDRLDIVPSGSRLIGRPSLRRGPGLEQNFPLEFPLAGFNIAPMSSENLRVRRATVDDLGALIPLWEAMRFAPAELERRVTEFQVVENAEGQVIGGIGFQIAERHGNIHSETFSDFSIADSVRPLLWKRVQALATNHGIARLWTQDSSPFWKHNGFSKADAEVLKRLPASWADYSGEWLTLSLKNEDSIVSLEKELSMFMAAEKQRTAQTFKHVKLMKAIATGLAIVLAVFVGIALFYLLRKNPGILTPGR